MDEKNGTPSKKSSNIDPQGKLLKRHQCLSKLTKTFIVIGNWSLEADTLLKPKSSKVESAMVLIQPSGK